MTDHLFLTETRSKCLIAAGIARWSSPTSCRSVDERDIKKGLVTMQAATRQAPLNSVVVPGAGRRGAPDSCPQTSRTNARGDQLRRRASARDVGAP